MSLEQILVGILALLIGAAFCFSGIKWFMVLLPIWGFLVGFTFGANAIFYIAGADHGFFADALAIVSGLVVGVLFAVVGEHERSRRIATKDAEAIGVSGA